MKKISKEEFENTPKKLANRSHAVRDLLNQIDVGESFSVSREEWKWKSASPSHLCRAVERQGSKRFDCYKQLDGSGWMIIRTA